MREEGIGGLGRNEEVNSRAVCPGNHRRSVCRCVRPKGKRQAPAEGAGEGPIPQAPANATTPEHQPPTAKKETIIQEQRRFSGAEKLEYSCGLLSLSRARAPVSVRRFAVLLLSFGIPLAQTLIGASLLLVMRDECAGRLTQT